MVNTLHPEGQGILYVFMLQAKFALVQIFVDLDVCSVSKSYVVMLL